MNALSNYLFLFHFDAIVVYSGAIYDDANIESDL